MSPLSDLRVEPSQPQPTSASAYLVVAVDVGWAALSLEAVVETLRPPVIEPLPDLPEYVRGVTILRGRPHAVLDLARLLGRPGAQAPRRLVVVKTDVEPVGLLVSDVLGVRQLSPSELEDPDPVLGGNEAIERIGKLGDRALLLLRSARLVSADLWPALLKRQGS